MNYVINKTEYITQIIIENITSLTYLTATIFSLKLESDKDHILATQSASTEAHLQSSSFLCQQYLHSTFPYDRHNKAMNATN